MKTPTALTPEQALVVSRAINVLIADAFALYVKTKNFHWHMTGPHFRDYHLMLDEQATQIYEGIDTLAERSIKLGQETIKSIGHIARLQTIVDDNDIDVDPRSMLTRLMNDNSQVNRNLRSAHSTCEDNDDSATASILEIMMDECERRIWFLSQCIS